ncbi:MAG: aldo/keto reductase [Candidatus Altiarchaeota archaeon]|nr:aldo/keto reductase [Candidatus Altiarchaeota archaeon]
MDFIKLGRTREKIPALGIGTYWGDMGEKHTVASDNEKTNSLKKAIEMGYTLIDTAESYGMGHSEKIVGRAIKEFTRDDLFIITKVSPENDGFVSLINAAKNSMKRLGTHIDLYLLHMPPKRPMAETIRALETVVDMGISRHIGVSNFNEKQIQKAFYSTKRYDLVANQSELSLIQQNTETVEFCEDFGITYMAHRPLGSGKAFKHPGFLELKRVADKLKKTPAQVALRWVLDTGAGAIIGSNDAKHQKENLGALNWTLEKDWDLLRDSFLSK